MLIRHALSAVYIDSLILKALLSAHRRVTSQHQRQRVTSHYSPQQQQQHRRLAVTWHQQFRMWLVAGLATWTWAWPDTRRAITITDDDRTTMAFNQMVLNHQPRAVVHSRSLPVLTSIRVCINHDHDSLQWGLAEDHDVNIQKFTIQSDETCHAQCRRRSQRVAVVNPTHRHSAVTWTRWRHHRRLAVMRTRWARLTRCQLVSRMRKDCRLESVRSYSPTIIDVDRQAAISTSYSLTAVEATPQCQQWR